MDKSNICWLAGLLEGEGWFDVPRRGKSLSVGIQSSDRDVIGRAASLLGGAVYGPYSSSGQNLKSAATRQHPYKSRYQTKVCGNVAAGWMMTLFPQLSSRRRERVAVALKAWKERPAFNGDKKFCPSGHPYAGENLVIKRNGNRSCRECSRLSRNPGTPRQRRIRRTSKQTIEHGLDGNKTAR